MSSFFSGLMSVGKAIGGAAKSWGEGTKVGRDIDKGRNVVGSFNAKKQPGMKGKGDAVSTTPPIPGAQDA